MLEELVVVHEELEVAEVIVELEMIQEELDIEMSMGMGWRVL